MSERNVPAEVTKLALIVSNIASRHAIMTSKSLAVFFQIFDSLSENKLLSNNQFEAIRTALLENVTEMNGIFEAHAALDRWIKEHVDDE